MRSLIEKAPAIISIIAAIAIVLSLLFNAGYFTILGYKLFTFMGLADHITSAMVWVVVAAVGFGVYYFLFWPIYKQFLEIPLKRFFRSSPRKKVAMGLTIALVLVLIPHYVIFKGRYPDTLFAVTFIPYIVLYAATLMFHKRSFFAQIKFSDRMLIIFICVVFATTYVCGMVSAYEGTISQDNYAVVVLSDGKKAKFLILKRLESGILVRGITQKVNFFIPWRNIDRVLMQDEAMELFGEEDEMMGHE